MQSINFDHIEMVASEVLISNMIESAPSNPQGDDLLILQALQSSLAKVQSAIHQDQLED